MLLLFGRLRIPLRDAYAVSCYMLHPVQVCMVRVPRMIYINGNDLVGLIRGECVQRLPDMGEESKLLYETWSGAEYYICYSWFSFQAGVDGVDGAGFSRIATLERNYNCYE